MKILLLDSGVGLIPFIREIIKQKKGNDYYFYMDYNFFPYGNKSNNFLKHRLKVLLKKFETLNIDLLLICCNTLSNIYLTNKFKTSYKVKDIFSLNYKHLNDNYMIVTPSLKKYYSKDKRIHSCSLAKKIEENNIVEIIKELKMMKYNKKIILGCTHYPLIKNLFRHYCSFSVVSYENIFINNIKSNNNRINMYAREYEYQIIKKYFPNININKYFLS